MTRTCLIDIVAAQSKVNLAAATFLLTKAFEKIKLLANKKVGGHVKFIVFLALMVSSIALSDFEETSTHIELSADNPEAALVIFPGGLVSPELYKDIAISLQENASVSTQIYIAKFWGKFANQVQSGKVLEIAKDLMASRGYENPESRVFLAGHSLGGIEGASVAKKKSIGGLLLWGSYLANAIVKGAELSTYPIPVLTLGGERDGKTGLNYIAREFYKHQNLKLNDGLRKPVILMPGVNHMQFADGSYLKGDLPADVSLDEARNMIVQYSIAFMDYILGVKGDAEKTLKSGLDYSKKQFSGLKMAGVWDRDICKYGQKEVAGLSVDQWKNIHIEEKVYSEKKKYGSFILSKSSIQESGSGFEVYLPSFVEKPFTILDISENAWISPEVIACKMRSQESIVEASSFNPMKEAPTCAELNLASLNKGISLLTEPQRARLERKFKNEFSTEVQSLDISKKEVFLSTALMDITDVVKERGDQWALGSFPKLSKVDNKWSLSTYSMKTSNEAIGNFGGAFYCKVIPSARFMEWLLLFNEK